jgi:hypothetical protein
MDRFNARLVSAISDILLEVELRDPREQSELHEIARRLQTLSLGYADGLCCDLIKRELGKKN